jgi:hypothetical protein
MQLTTRKGFAIANTSKIKMRGFLLELNHIDAEGEENNIAYEILEIPKLNDGVLELKYVSLVIWDLLEGAYKKEGINQVFALTKDGKESLMRYQVKETDDEPMTHIDPPHPDTHKNFMDRVEKKAKKIHNSSDISYVRSRLMISSLKEYLEGK